MTVTNTTGVVGSDGNVPIYDPDGKWTIWSIYEIYTADSPGKNRYIPKIKDYVIDPDTFTTYVVEGLDPLTLYPTLKEIRPANMSFSFTQTDVLFGVGPGTESDTYRVYINKNTMPYTLSVDSRLTVGGMSTSYCKIFKGPLSGKDSQVVSQVYDSQGRFVSENVKLETVTLDSHINYSLKMVPACNTVADLIDNEIVTAVFYSDAGYEVSKRQLKVENTTFIRNLDASTKYVSHIGLKSPFLSANDDSAINYPLNVPIDALNLMGLVYYTDGSIVEMAVDGTKFKMFGLDQYVSSIVGQKVDLVLAYNLSAGEGSIAGNTVNGKTITEAYKLVTINPNNSYTVKLFGYPFWVDESTGYQMRWWLYNLDRNIFYEVTDKVVFAQNTGAFDPKGFGYLQKKTVSLNLRQVSGSFKPFVHTQTVEIALNATPQAGTSAWTVVQEALPNRKQYGSGIYARRIVDIAANTTRVNLSLNSPSLDIWLDNLYYRVEPLINPATEVSALRPTHFAVGYNGKETEYSLDQWDQNLSLASSPDLYKTLTVRFIKRTSSGDLELAIVAVLVRP